MPETTDGKVYPDATGHVRLWEHLQALAESTSPIVCTSGTRPAGKVGRRIFETDTGRELVYYDPPGAAAAGWYRPWNLPWGRLGRFTTGLTSPYQNNVGAVFASGNLDVIAGRQYRLHANMLLDGQANDAEAEVLLRAGGVAVEGAFHTLKIAGRGNYVEVEDDTYSPAASGSVLFELFMRASVGAVRNLVVGNNVAGISVYDVGPA